MANFFGRYKALSQKSPHVVAALTYPAITGLGDYLCQQYEGNKWDPQRSLGFLLYGLLRGPMVHTVKRVVTANCMTKPHLAMAAVANEFIVVPGIAIPMYFTCQGTAYGRSFSEIKQSLQAEFTNVSSRSICYWIPVSFVSFAFVPQMHVVAFTGTMGVGWYFLLSLITNGEKQQSQEKQQSLTSTSSDQT